MMKVYVVQILSQIEWYNNSPSIYWTKEKAIHTFRSICKSLLEDEGIDYIDLDKDYDSWTVDCWDLVYYTVNKHLDIWWVYVECYEDFII